MDRGNKFVALIEVMHERRSVRAYSAEIVDRTTLDALLRAAVQAPTAMHMEPWRFVVVQDPDVLRRISNRAKDSLMGDAQRLHAPLAASSPFFSPDFNVFYDAPTLVVIGAPLRGHFVQADCWLAAQNLMLAAHAMGLGTCVIGSAVAALNLPQTQQELGIPPDIYAVVPIIVGKPRGEPGPSPRQAPQILAWLEPPA